MSSSGGLTASPLQPDLTFNWVFLVELLVCGILTLFFLFYFNRVFATTISYGLRAWTWHKYRVYIDVQALQISLLGGRIFFKGFRYHGNNETILIHSGYVTWKYWLRNVRELELQHAKRSVARREASSSDIDEDKDPSRNLEKAEIQGRSPTTLPCRVTVSLQGAEWFVYNRSAAYDAVVAGMTQQVNENVTSIPTGHTSECSEPNLRKRAFPKEDASRDSLPSKYSPDSARTDSQIDEKFAFMPEHANPQASTFVRANSSKSDDSSQGSQDNAFILRFLPIQIECNKAAVVLGNEHTKSVLITKVDKASGVVDATSSTNLDQYKQLINLKFVHPVIQMKPNDDYKEGQTAAASRIKKGQVQQPENDKPHVHSHSFLQRQRRRVWHRLQDLIPAFRSSVESFSSGEQVPMSAEDDRPDANRWQGLSRYLDDNEKDDKARWSSIEYATVSTIVDSPETTMSFYWDAIGVVADHSESPERRRGKDAFNINGDIPPEWGINISLKGATINYGPWADRQRIEIQRVFFPNLCKDSTPSRMLAPGQLRVPTELKLYIEFEEETTLRIPVREESKNWKWTKQPDDIGGVQRNEKRANAKGRKSKADKGTPGPEIRPFGWLDIKVAANTTVIYNMDMVASSSGFSNKLELDLPRIEINTSVNHNLLWRSERNRVACDLSNPLQWNGHHNWTFDIESSGLELFILREHVFLIIDLVDDWSSGPPAEYLTFSPMQYLVSLSLNDFKLYLNVNDTNIVNNPSDLDDNAFMIIFGLSLRANINIPLVKFRPHRNDISFGVDVEKAGLKLHVPPWNTQATFMTSTEVATLKSLAIEGTYQYCATTSASNTDTLLLSVHGTGPVAQFYGFVIRYFLKIKDNYFGEDIRFKTLEEYQEVLRAKRGEIEAVINSQPHKKSNDLDVILSVKADDSVVILPSNLYSSMNHIRIEIATLSADLRFTNYYMDLEVALDALAFSQSNEEEEATETPLSATSSTQLFIDGITASGNRLFGLPPDEPTYVCNWDFGVGAVTGECTTSFLSQLTNGAQAFAFSFDDDENALPRITEIILHDVTFLRASIESVRIWLHVEDAAFLLSTSTVSVNLNDWAGSHYSTKLNLQVPDLRLACVDAESASRHRSRAQQPVETHALFHTTIKLGMIERKLEFEEKRQLQQEHIQRHDQRTHRADFLLSNEDLDNSILTAVDPPAMRVPPMPIPVAEANLLDNEHQSVRSDKSSPLPRSRSAARSSSFISVSSASIRSDGSIVRATNSRKVGDEPLGISRARSLHMKSENYRAPVRDMSASTGRVSSFYSAVGDHKALPPSNVTFSSSYVAPYFPLDSVEPDNKDLPHVSHNLEGTFPPDEDRFGLEDINADSLDPRASHTSFIIELPSGVAAFLNPKALDAAAALLSALQAVDPVDLLDKLQIDSMRKMFDLKKQKVRSGQTLDICLSAPAVNLRLLNSGATQSFQDNKSIHDQYDLSLAGLMVTSRSKTMALDTGVEEDARKSSALHISLRSAGVAAKERSKDIGDTQAAINGALEDVVLWTASDAHSSANIFFKNMEVTAASSKVEYLASLVHRTTVLASRTSELFSSCIKQQENRVRLFTYLVATAMKDISDPQCLTRPSYVLRSATDHLRTSDSWKIITRMHYMYTSLDGSSRDDLAVRCLHNTETVPEDARQRVVEGFNEWRSWDLHNIQGCLVLGQVFGFGEVPTPGSRTPRILRISLNTESIRIILDPGPKQNEVSLAFLTATFQSNDTTSEPSALPSFEEPPQRADSLQVFCADVAVNLNWEICELAEDILQLMHQSEDSSGSASELLTTIPRHGSKSKSNLHIIIATEKSSITLDTINIRAFSISKGLRASLVILDGSTGRSGSTMSLMLAADAATSKVKSHSQEMTLHQLRRPCVYASYDNHNLDGIENNTLKLAANCEELSFVVKQDILALIQILDLVIGDELSQLHRIQTKLPPRQAPVRSRSIDDVRSSVTKINVALFLDMYHISIPLLHTLTYHVSGVVARASLMAQLDTEVVFDFDIQDHYHDFQTTNGNKMQSISLLQMPSTNGRIAIHMSDDENVVSVFASVEPVELDAAAIHNLLAAINRPEISNVLDEIKEDVATVRGHFQEIYGHQQIPEEGTTSPKGKPLIYDAHLTLAGFAIFANAKEALSNHIAARLNLNLGCVQFRLANRLENEGSILPFPEMRVGLRQVMLELSRWNNQAMEPCGGMSLSALLTATSRMNGTAEPIRSYHLKVDELKINIFAETASSVVDVMNHLQDKIKDIDWSREKQYFHKLRQPKTPFAGQVEIGETSSVMFASMYSLEISEVHISWVVKSPGGAERASGTDADNLVLSLKRINLSTKKENSARLSIENLQLQMVPPSHDKRQRSSNSALLPEVIFNVGYVSSADARRLAFQAAGKSLDLRLTSQFIIPAAEIQKSLASATEMVKIASASWTRDQQAAPEETPRGKPFFGNKRMESLLVDADFAGAVVYLTSKHDLEASRTKAARFPHSGRYGQFSTVDASNNTVLRAPGLAWKVEYKDNGTDEPSLNAEVKVDASTNILYPAVVPLIMEISSTVKEMVSDKDKDLELPTLKASPQKFMEASEDNILTADPNRVLGKTKLNLGIRICKQEFSLSCQPIARVAATAKFDDIYLTVNTVRSNEHGHFFAISAAITQLQVSVQHVYSRESTGSFHVDTVFLSLMNSKHVSGTSGVSAILKISPMKVLINAKQLQDFLLFREIWVPVEIRQSAATSSVSPPTPQQSQTFLVQRYQQVAATGAFPWNATVSIAELDVQLDLGQALGKSAFMISNFWISSKKNSDWEQNLCLGFDKVGIDSSGRMSGLVALQDFKVRTSIQWPAREMALNQTPLIQGSLKFSQLRIKAAFDYQAFLVADITSFEFLMYNVRHASRAQGDRLVAILDGEAVQVFCTTTTAAQALALYQAFLRLVQEKRSNYEASLSEIERFMQRKPSSVPAPTTQSSSLQPLLIPEESKAIKSPISLHTDVIVLLKAVNVGAFPNTFSDHQVFKVEALDAQARFAVAMTDGKIHSMLNLTLGQLSIGLAGVKKPDIPKTVGELSVEDVVKSAIGSRGGTILKVPKVEASMQTWQLPDSNHIDYIFKSSFEGKVEVGWNYSRVSYIRGMWGSHSRSLAQKLGKPLPPSAVKITGVPDEADAKRKSGDQQKITAEVNVPQSKYDYRALEPPVIETPQLRDMGEATPPLEWIGLHRERLPNLTHQIVIVTLLELASEVEDAYAKILGSS